MLKNWLIWGLSGVLYFTSIDDWWLDLGFSG
uniref:Uncharacterized protein n=1 Tax=Rhizophora mucronata TaxID=61149 RepID=A0A2P2MZ99_RHIMU